MTSAQGTSPLQADALLYINQIHNTVITGGNELETDIDESWIWARARRPIILNLNAPLTAQNGSGNVTLTLGSTAGTFGTIPAQNSSNISVEGWYLKPDNGPEVYRITQHTSGSANFSLDAAFPQANYASTFSCFQLEYDLVTSYLVCDTLNDTFDFIESGTTVLSASLAHGSYTPAAYATAVAAALTSASTHGNTYSGSYDTIQRLFTYTSNLGGSGTPIFTIVGNGTNYYRSGWAESGFDYLTQAGAATYTGNYALSATARLTQPARIYYGFQYDFGGQSGQVSNVDPVRFEFEYPLIDVRQGTPQHFCITGERAYDGKLSVRFNKYPAQAKRVEFEHVPWPKDLQNNAQSIPKIPRKYIRILEYGAAHFLSTDKTSDKAQTWLSTAQNMLKSMMKANRQELAKTGLNFGSVIARMDMMPDKSYRRKNLYGYDSQDS